MKKIIFWTCVVAFFSHPFMLFSADSSAKSAKSDKSNAAEGTRKPYMGDPSAKRGFVLGYDEGVKAGKEDKKVGKKENPSSHEEYKMGEKKYRYEYGSRANFINGYQGGFLKGYKSGYNREKLDAEAAKNEKLKEKEKPTEKNNGSNAKSSKSTQENSQITSSKSNQTTAVKPTTPAKSKPKTSSTAEDAL